MFGSISTCAEAVSSGAKKVFTSDKPLLNWLANSYFGTGNLYVSESLRSNPLSVAFRAGSTLRPAVDTAIIDMLTNLSWSESHEALMNTWFPKGVADAPFTDQTLDVPMFAAACALVGTTLAIAGVQLALEQRLIFARAHDKSAERLYSEPAEDRSRTHRGCSRRSGWRAGRSTRGCCRRCRCGGAGNRGGAARCCARRRGGEGGKSDDATVAANRRA
jgi:hypothetical protein